MMPAAAKRAGAEPGRGRTPAHDSAARHARRHGAPRAAARLAARRPAANRRFPTEGRRRRRLRLSVGIPAGAALVFAAAVAVSQYDVFRIRHVTFRGVVNARPAVLLAEAGLARKRSLLDDLSFVPENLARDPLIRSARVERVFPGRVVVSVAERLPVAYWADELLWPVDADGRVLPLSPAYHGWDLPILMAAPVRAATSRGPAAVIGEGRLVDADARALLRLVVGIRDRIPEIARRISVAQLEPDGRVVLHMMGSAGSGGGAESAGAAGAGSDPLAAGVTAAAPTARAERGSGARAPGAAVSSEVRLRLETPLDKVALLADVLRDLEMKRMGFRLVDLSFADQIVVRPLTPPRADAGSRRRSAEADPPAGPRSGPGAAAPEMHRRADESTVVPDARGAGAAGGHPGADAEASPELRSFEEI